MGDNNPSVTFLRVTRLENGKNIKIYTTGTLVRHSSFLHQFILTAAYCIKDAVKVEAAIGCTTVCKWTRFVELRYWVANEKYYSSCRYDIALIMVNPWQCIDNLAINLPDIRYSPHGAYKTVGWNCLQEGHLDRFLRVTEVHEMTSQKARIARLFGSEVFYGKLCNGRTRLGDSGAPLIQTDRDGSPVIFGITVGCFWISGVQHTAFLKVQQHLKWIESQLKMYSTQFPYCSNELCVKD